MDWLKGEADCRAVEVPEIMLGEQECLRQTGVFLMQREYPGMLSSHIRCPALCGPRGQN